MLNVYNHQLHRFVSHFQKLIIIFMVRLFNIVVGDVLSRYLF